jgi:hypothetical protein
LRESENEREREREGSALRRAVWGYLYRVSPTLPATARLCRAPVCSYIARSSLLLSSLRGALVIPFYRYKEMPSCTMGV